MGNGDKNKIIRMRSPDHDWMCIGRCVRSLRALVTTCDGQRSRQVKS